MNICLIKINLLFANMILFYSLTAQQNEVALYTSDQLDLDIARFKPHRAAYKNYYFQDKQEKLGGYIIIEVDQAHLWSKPSLLVNWSREGIGSTAHDMVWTDQDLAIKHRQMPSNGFPGGVILENHYYGNRTDVLFTNPNKVDGLDTLSFSYPQNETLFKYHHLYSHEKKFKKVHNVIIWPYLISAIDWSKHKDLILPGFSPMGIQEYYYRLIFQGQITIQDKSGNIYDGFIVSGFRTDDLNQLKSAKPTDPIPRSDYYISKDAPYFLGKVVYTPTKGGEKLIHSKEVFLGFNLLEFSFQEHMDEMIEESRKELLDFNMPWNQE